MSSSTNEIHSKEEWIVADDGMEIFTKTWIPAGKPVASIVFVHGLGEHIGRYDSVFEDFNKAGFQVSAFDQRGFGKTGKRTGALGCTGGYAKAIPDITAALERGKIEGVPLFLMGHSYGGGLVLNYDCIGSLRKELSGLIASAPCVLAAPATRPYWPTIKVAGLASWFLPSFQIATKLKAMFISRDPDQVVKYNTDLLVHGYGTILGLYDMLANGQALINYRYKQITKEVPILICHGSADHLTDQKASHDFFNKIQVPDKQYRLYDGYYHELHNEPEKYRRIVIDYYIEWINKHLPSSSK